MEPHGQSPWYLGQRPRGATFPVIHRDGPVTRWRIPPPGQTGGSPAAGMNAKMTYQNAPEIPALWAGCFSMKTFSCLLNLVI
jgi:hypothetical protein